MSIPVFYNRYFSKSTAARGQTVDVTFDFSFMSPVIPSVNTWFANLADNVGGGFDATGILGFFDIISVTTTNLTPTPINRVVTGQNNTVHGCLRTWASGGSYPGPVSPLSAVWKPIGPSPISRLRIVARAVVRENAVPGQVIGVPIRVTPVDNANLNAGEMMVDLGSDMFLTILNDNNYQRTLTIVRAN